MSLHEQCMGATDEWYTPSHVFHAMDCRFDVDVASPPIPLSWIPATRFLSERSLELEWSGFVWMNPPFGGRNAISPWLDKFVAHGDGIALVPDRTSAPWWQRFAPRMDAVLFVGPKIKFIGADGKPGRSPAQGTCLMAAGGKGYAALCRARRNGLGVLMEIRR
jgi:hypothetical protein